MRQSSVRPLPLRMARYLEEAVAGIALVVLVAAVCWGVVTRYVTATSAAWTGDVTSVAFAWLIFVGSAAAFKYGAHMSVDIFWRRLPPCARRYFGATIDAVILVFLAYATWLGIGFCLASMDDPLPILRWPRAVLYAALVVGLVCMFVRYAEIAWRKLQGVTAPTHRVPGPDAGDTRWG